MARGLVKGHTLVYVLNLLWVVSVASGSLVSDPRSICCQLLPSHTIGPSSNPSCSSMNIKSDIALSKSMHPLPESAVV
jgi:hypothetical protein